jgi:hypothetical protein
MQLCNFPKNLVLYSLFWILLVSEKIKSRVIFFCEIQYVCALENELRTVKNRFKLKQNIAIIDKANVSSQQQDGVFNNLINVPKIAISDHYSIQPVCLTRKINQKDYPSLHVRTVAGQIGPKQNRPQVKSAPCYIYKIKWKSRYLTVLSP